MPICDLRSYYLKVMASRALERAAFQHERNTLLDSGCCLLVVQARVIGSISGTINTLFTSITLIPSNMMLLFAADQDIPKSVVC